MAKKSKRGRNRKKNVTSKTHKRVENISRVSKFRYLRWLWFLIIPVGGSIASYFGALDAVSKLIWKPDVALTFSNPKMAIVSVWNISSTVVQQPKYGVHLLNVDEAVTSVNFLPIPTHLGDYIQPRQRLGPNQMLESLEIQPHLKEGDRLIGWAYVMCPDCPRHK